MYVPMVKIHQLEYCTEILHTVTRAVVPMERQTQTGSEPKYTWYMSVFPSARNSFKHLNTSTSFGKKGSIWLFPFCWQCHIKSILSPCRSHPLVKKILELLFNATCLSVTHSIFKSRKKHFNHSWGNCKCLFDSIIYTPVNIISIMWGVSDGSSCVEPVLSR